MTNPSLSGPDGPEVPALIKAAAAAKLCGVSLRTWSRLKAEGNVPNPVLVGERIERYLRTELLAWATAGCPSRDQWKNMRDNGYLRRGK